MNYRKNFKEWVIHWLWFIFIITVFAVWAYQYTEYQNIEDVASEQLLTKDIFNQLLANVRDFKSNIYTMSWSLDWIKRDSDVFIDNTQWTFSNIPLIASSTTLSTWVLELPRWVYYVIPNVAFTLSGTWHYWANIFAEKDSWDWVVSTLYSLYNQNSWTTQNPFMFAVGSDTAKVKITIKIYWDWTYSWTIQNQVSSSAYYYKKISD